MSSRRHSCFEKHWISFAKAILRRPELWALGIGVKPATDDSIVGLGGRVSGNELFRNLTDSKRLRLDVGIVGSH